MSATDKDTGEAGTVEYELEESSSFFAVGSSDGGIRLTSSPESGRCNSKTSCLKKQNLKTYNITNVEGPERRICMWASRLKKGLIHHRILPTSTIRYV